MPYLINPGGRIVAVDDPVQFQRWRTTPGFEVLTPEQATEYQNQRLAMLDRDKRKESVGADGIYFATVTQGDRADGYGTSSEHLIQELQKLDVKVSTSYTGQNITLLYHAPYSITRMESPFRIIYTMFESDKIPDEWGPYLEGADLILVPSKWCASVFKKSGFDARVVPLGYNDNVYKYVERQNKRDNRQTFNFLHYNAFNIRKGFPEVFKAFIAEFAKDEPVKMIFKTTQRREQIPDMFRYLDETYPNIEIICEQLPQKQMQSLMERSDCFVFPSRGEGFGMTPMEAMATGMPAIVPNAHGISEYFDPKCMYEVKVEGMCPALYSRYKNVDVGKMVVCSVDDLRRKMRYVYEHQSEALERGKAASEYVKSWTYKQTAAQLKIIIEEISRLPVPARQMINFLKLEKVT